MKVVWYLIVAALLGTALEFASGTLDGGIGALGASADILYMVLGGTLVGLFSEIVLARSARSHRVVLALGAIIFCAIRLAALRAGGPDSMLNAIDMAVISIGVGVAVFSPIEKLFGASESSGQLDVPLNVAYCIVGSALGPVVSECATYLTAWVSPVSKVIGAHSWPSVVQLVALVVFVETTAYFLHRAKHTVPILWKFHSIHHSSKELHWSSSFRMHIGEILLDRCLLGIPFILLGANPTVVGLYITASFFYGVYCHSDVRIRNKWLSKFLVTPRFHHWHHARDVAGNGWNFAANFSLLDRVFGTYHLPETEWPDRYGVRNEEIPEGFCYQLIHPLRGENATD